MGGDLELVKRILNQYPSLMLKSINDNGNETDYEFIGSKEDCEELAYSWQGERGSFEDRYTDDSKFDI